MVGPTKWLGAVAAALFIVLGRMAPAHADSFHLIVRITSDNSRALSDRIRGQTSDLSVELVTVDTGPLDATLPSQVGSASTIAQVYSADAVVWYDDLALGPAHEARLLVLQPKAKRILVRGVGDSGLGAATGASSESAELEAAALIVRAAVQAMMQGGVIGIEQSRIVGVEAPKGPAPPPPIAPFESGDAPTALPGIYRVPVAGPFGRLGFAGAAAAGYGVTDSVLGEGDINQRIFATAAASVRPNEWLAAAVRFDGRYDWHRHVAEGDTSGWVGEPHIDVRIDPSTPGDLQIGGQASLGFPGAHAPSIRFAATSPELSLFATYAPAAHPIAISSLFGFRIDRGKEAIDDPNLLTRAQLLSIGASDTNALLLGIGVVGRLANGWQALGEWTWDLRVPANGVDATVSPMRFDAGARVVPKEGGNVQLQAFVEFSPSARPTIGPGEPLVIVEPRAAILLGVNLLPPRAGSSSDITRDPSATPAVLHK